VVYRPLRRTYDSDLAEAQLSIIGIRLAKLWLFVKIDLLFQSSPAVLLDTASIITILRNSKKMVICDERSGGFR
jgi:hypothetical protein